MFSAPLEPMETHCNFKTERVERIRDQQLDVLFKLYLEMGAVGLQWEEVSSNFPFSGSTSLQFLQCLRSLMFRPSRKHGRSGVTGAKT